MNYGLHACFGKQIDEEWERDTLYMLWQLSDIGSWQ